jgi:hypothetical protein
MRLLDINWLEYCRDSLLNANETAWKDYLFSIGLFGSQKLFLAKYTTL